MTAPTEPTEPTAITSAPAVPDSSVAEPTFDSQFEAFLSYLKNTLVGGINAALTNVYNNAVIAVNEATAAASSANTATTQAGIATTKAGETEADAIATAADRVQTGLDRVAAAGSASTAVAAALSASDDADAVAAGLASIAGGPVASINGQTGIVTIAATDLAAAASQAEMEAGAEAALRSMSPLRVGQSIAAQLGIKTAAATSKATPIDADSLPISDNAAANATKRLTWGNLKATLKTYFDTLYQAVLVSGTNIKTINSLSLLGSGNLVVGGGAWNYLGTVTFNESPEVDVEWVNAGYDKVLIVSNGITSTANGGFYCRLKIGGAYKSDSYFFHSEVSSSAAGTYSGDNSTSAAQIKLMNIGGFSNRFNEVCLCLTSPGSTGVYPSIRYDGSKTDSGYVTLGNGAGGSGYSGAVTGVRLFPQLGTITGALHLYVLKTS